MMITLQIDQHRVAVPQGTTILEAAQQAGIAIPTLCHLQGHPALTSCFVCVVRVNGGARLLPACATQVAEGMIVDSETDEVRTARRTALELLLSDHLGDCIGPCQSACPAHMDIPTMLRHIADGNPRAALITVKQHIALPAVLGRICPEICERACRRGQHDTAVSICKQKQYVADVDLSSGAPYHPTCLPATGKRVIIVGAGPAGLAAAYYLAQLGHTCTIVDSNGAPGGALRTTVPASRLPVEVLDTEIATITALGVHFRGKNTIGVDLSLDAICDDADAVLLAMGPISADQALGLAYAGKGLKIDRETMQTNRAGVFACGSTVTPSQHAVRAVASGRDAALAIDAYLMKRPAHDDDLYTVHMGKLDSDEMSAVLQGLNAITGHPGLTSARQTPKPGAEAGFTNEEAVTEAQRCLHCDCRKLHTCKLRQHAKTYDARGNAYKSERRRFSWEFTHPDVIFEPGKCIACGICVQLAEEAREDLGLTFIGRGFTVRVGIPFSETLNAALTLVAHSAVGACPTAALSTREARSSETDTITALASRDE